MRYVSGPYWQGQLLRDIHEIEIALTRRYDRGGVITDAAEQKSWRERVEDASFGRNTVMYDDQGNPSVMVVVYSMVLSDLITGKSNNIHPAFNVGGTIYPVIFISKYQNIVAGSGSSARALSLRHKDPKVSIDFDSVRSACTQKGTGWHLMTNAEWAAIALWCWANGHLPRGNNYYGKDYSVPTEKGVPSYVYLSGQNYNIGRNLTGSGPVSWSHDDTPFGIYDMNGNIWEWVSGLRLNNGEIQVIPDNNAADNTVSHAVDSTAWKAILQDGSLVDPESADTLKYDAETDTPSGIKVNTSVVNQTTDNNSVSKSFETVAAETGVTVPDLLKYLGLFPVDSAHGGDYLYLRNNSERLPIRGGYWNRGAGAGVFALSLSDPRSNVFAFIGFRAAYVG